MRNSFEDSDLYCYCIEEKEEILKYKWLESEKRGYDIGWFRALREWKMKHQADWKKARKNPTEINR